MSRQKQKMAEKLQLSFRQQLIQEDYVHGFCIWWQLT